MKKFETLFKYIKNNKTNFIISTLLFTASLISFGAGTYYAKNTVNSIYKEAIKTNDEIFVDIEKINKRISEEEALKFDEKFYPENVYKTIELDVSRQIYFPNIDRSHFLKNHILYVLENDNKLNYKFGSKPVEDYEIALTDYATRAFYEYGIKNTYNEISKEEIKEDLSVLIDKVLVTDFGNLTIKGIIDTGFDLKLYDSSNWYFELENLVNNSVLFSHNLNSKIKDFYYSKPKGKLPIGGLLSPDRQSDNLNYINDTSTYSEYLYKFSKEQNNENDIYLSYDAISYLINFDGYKNKKVTLPSKFNFNKEDLNTNLYLDSFFRALDEYVLEYTATKYYSEAYINKSFDIDKYEKKLNKEDSLVEEDKKDAYKIFLTDVYNFGITYDNFFQNNPHHYKITECTKELVDYIFSEYPELIDLKNKEILYTISEEDKGSIKIGGISLTNGFNSPVSIVPKELFNRLCDNNIYSSIHIDKDAANLNFGSLMKLLNENKELDVFNNDNLSSWLWIHDDIYRIFKIVLFSLSALLFSALIVVQFIFLKYKFILKKVKNDENHKDVFNYLISISSLSMVISLILLPLINFLGDLLAKTFINDAPFLTSGIVGMEYLALLLGTIFVLSIFLLFTICFKNKYKIKNDD